MINYLASKILSLIGSQNIVIKGLGESHCLH